MSLQIPMISADEVDNKLSWTAVLNALNEGHRKNPAEIGDLLLKEKDRSILNRSAWISGLGIGLKTMTIFPGNTNLKPPVPSIHGVFVLFDDDVGMVRALIDGVLVTKWKTAADSALGARFLARPGSRNLLIAGAGVVARSLVEAYSEVFPSLNEIVLWNRTASRADALATEMSGLGYRVSVATDLSKAAGNADIISTATMSSQPVLFGEWVKPGTHVDLIGAFTPDMREADDELIRKGRVFVDSRETTVHHIGELIDPIKAGVIVEADVLGDLYDLCNGSPGRTSGDEITIFKNGGGAHLDLMTANVISEVYFGA